MIGWVLAILFFAMDVALFCTAREMRHRLIEEMKTTEYLSARLAEFGIAASRRTSAQPKENERGTRT